MQPNPFHYVGADMHRADLLREASELRRTFSETDLARIRQRLTLPAVFAPLCACLQWLTEEFAPTPWHAETERPIARPLSISGPQ